ncbi:MAG: hypothetical protein Q9P01_09200 [Anaerolineae bacterium]|nr:hypothetical protein [Anaerolineae bacterium]
MLQKKIFKLVLFLLLLIMSTSILAQDGNILVVARAVDATGLDPHTQTTFASLRLLELIYEPLVVTDSDLNLQPALATGWEFS